MSARNKEKMVRLDLMKLKKNRSTLSQSINVLIVRFSLIDETRSVWSCPWKWTWRPGPPPRPSRPCLRSSKTSPITIGTSGWSGSARAVSMSEWAFHHQSCWSILTLKHMLIIELWPQFSGISEYLPIIRSTTPTTIKSTLITIKKRDLQIQGTFFGVIQERRDTYWSLFLNSLKITIFFRIFPRPDAKFFLVDLFFLKIFCRAEYCFVLDHDQVRSRP